MTVFGLTLVLAAAVCHATWNVLLKRVDGRPEVVWLFSAVSSFIYLPLAVFIVVTQQPVFGLPEWVFVAGSTGLHLGYFLLLQIGYRRGDLSLVYPVARATGPLLSAGFAVAFLGEAVTLPVAIGALCVIGGVVGLTRRSGAGAAITEGSAGPSLAFGFGAGVMIGSYTVWDAYAVSVLLVPPLLLDYASSLIRTGLLAPLAARRKAQVAAHWRNHRVHILAIAVFNPLAYILVLEALTFTPVVYVAPARELSVVLAVLAGSILLGEGDLGRRMGWAVVILAGVSILAAG